MARADGSPVRASQRLGVARVRSAYAQVAEQLRDLIVTGQLSPGDQLPTEPELCAAFGVSRSTVREALRSLAAQHLVYTSRGVTGGTFVAHTDPHTISAYLETSIGLLSTDVVSIDEMMAVREMLEVPAARIAASQHADEDLDALRDIVAQEAGNADPQHLGPQNFHNLLLTCTHNSLLEIVAQPIFSVLRTRFLRANAPAWLWERAGTDHERILAAIERGDEDGAAGAMREHLRRIRGAYLEMDKVSHQVDQA